MKLILINNKFVPAQSAKISILSDSFQRGYGIFETLRTFDDKKLFKEKDHIDRLFESAKKIDLKLKQNKTEILKMLHKVIKKSPHKIQRLKIITIKEGIIITSLPFKDDKGLYRGVNLMSVKTTRSLPEIKSISYLPSLLAHEKAVHKGFYDALLVDKNEEVYEGAYSNIFWFEENTLCTRKDEILEGITRKAVMELSPYKIQFKKIKLKDLVKKKEIFLTQSTRGIIPVTQIDKTKIATGLPGKRTKDLMEILKTKQNDLS